MIRNLKTTIFVLIVAFTTPVFSADYDKGIDYYRNKQYTAAIKELMPLAENGHAKSMYRIGYMHYRGRGFTKNHEKASHWIKLAAETGHRGAIYIMGWLYEHGHGVKWDEQKALELYLEAARKGDGRAALRIGVIHSGDRDYTIRQDRNVSVFWYHVVFRLKSKWAKKRVRRILSTDRYAHGFFDLDKAKRDADAWIKKHGLE